MKWHFFLSLVGMSVHNVIEIALCVLEFRHVIQSGALPQTLEANCTQSERSMENLKDPFRLLAIEILGTESRDLWTIIGGVLSKNVF